MFYILVSKDVYVIEEPFESYENNSNQDESLQLETDIFEESRSKYYFHFNMLKYI